MKFIPSFLILIGFISACKVAKPRTDKIPEKEKFEFPLDWIGTYEGDLYIHSNKKMDTIRMRLYIDPPNNEGYYPWTIVYGEEDVRQYGLEAVNTENGHYRINEYNSIELDGFLFENNFISRFEVMNSNLLVDYERVPDGMFIRFFVSEREKYNSTGGEVIASDTIPMVYNYRVAAYQKAFLVKKL